MTGLNHRMKKMEKDELSKYLNACAQPQSNYAVDNLIDGAQFTPFRRFRQAVIEYSNGSKVIGDCEDDIELLVLKISYTEYKISKLVNNSDVKSTFKRNKLKVKLKTKRRNLERMSRILEGKKKETAKHYQNIIKYKEELRFTGKETEEVIYQNLQETEGDHYILKLAMDAAANNVQSHGGPPVGILLALQQLEEKDLKKAHGLIAALTQRISALAYTPELREKDAITMLEKEGYKLLNNSKVQGLSRS